MHSRYHCGMSMLKDRRKRTEAKRQHARPVAPIVLVQRRARRSGTRSLYHRPMADRTINREAWAALLAELIKTESRNKKAAFARLVGVDPKSINLWLACAVDVSEESVRRVARAVGQSPIDMLVQVGYYSAAEVEQAPAAPAIPANDPALKVIEDSGYPPHVKARMRERLYQMRQQREAAEIEEVKWWIDQARGT